MGAQQGTNTRTGLVIAVAVAIVAVIAAVATAMALKSGSGDASSGGTAGASAGPTAEPTEYYFEAVYGEGIEAQYKLLELKADSSGRLVGTYKVTHFSDVDGEPREMKGREKYFDVTVEGTRFTLTNQENRRVHEGTLQNDVLTVEPQLGNEGEWQRIPSARKYYDDIETAARDTRCTAPYGRCDK